MTQPDSSTFPMKKTHWRSLSLALPFLLAAALMLWSLRNPGHGPEQATHKDIQQAQEFAVMPASFGELIETLTKRGSSPAREQELGPDEIAVLTGRRDWMKAAMKASPDAALQHCISRREYEALPEQAKAFVEKPYNQNADLALYPNAACNCAVSDLTNVPHPHTRWRLTLDGKEYPAVVYGDRLLHQTKNKHPVHGFTLDGDALVAEATFESVGPEDASFLAGLPLGAPQATLDLITGEPLVAEPVVAIAGGKRFLLNSDASVDQLNENLAKLNANAGPENGANLFLEMAAGVAGSENIDWAELNDRSSRIAYSWTTNTKNFIVLRVSFADFLHTDGPTERQDEVDFLNGEVSNGFYQFSSGKLSLDATVTDWIQLGNRADYTGSSAAGDAAAAAYKAVHGPNSLDGYDYVGYAFSPGSFGGLLLGQVGGRYTWYDWNQTSFYGYVHELGHNLGLGHAQLWSTTDGSVVGTGTSIDYGHAWDIMGAAGRSIINHYHVLGKKNLNWLDSGTNWLDVNTAGSGTRRVYRFDHPGTDSANALRALRVNKDGSGNYYWLGYRRAAMTNPWLRNGIELIWQQAGDGKGHLLDVTPNSPNGRNDCAILVGQTYSDPAGNVHITNVAQGGEDENAWLDINVQVGPFPGNQNPVINSVTVPSTAFAGESIEVSANATDPDGDTLAYHWSWGDFEPGPNASTASHAWNSGGTKTVTLTVSDMKGGTATASYPVTVTDPAANWSQLTVAGSSDLGAVIYDYGRFVAASSSGMRFSIDGSTWQTIPNTNGARDVVASSDSQVFIGVGWRSGNSTIYRSIDGRKWDVMPLPSISDLYSVDYADGAFVAVGLGGTVFRSTDQGLTWTDLPVPGADGLRYVAAGDGVIIACEWFASWVSFDDGQTWENRYQAMRTGGIIHDVKFIDGCFYTTLDQGMRVSDDGIRWGFNTFNSGPEYNIRSVAAGPNRMIFVGGLFKPAENPTLPVPIVFSSTAGEFFHDTGEYDLPVNLNPVYADGRFFAVTSNQAYFTGSDHPDNVAPQISITGPTTGEVLETITFTANATDLDGDPLTLLWDFNDGSLLAEGTAVTKSYQVGGIYEVKCTATDKKGGVTVTTHSITISDPLNTWANGEVAPSRSMTNVHYLNGRYIASSNGNIHFSLDGVSWTSQAMRDGDFRGRAVAWDGTRYVMVGEWYSGALGWHARAWTSVDGKTWSVDGSFVHPDSIWDLSYKNGTFLAVGENGLIARSTDGGLTWSTSSISGAATLRAVAATNSGFVTIDSNQVWTSADGVTWTERTSGLQNFTELKDIAANGDTVAITGWLTGIQVSLDGGETYTRKSISAGNDDLFRVTYGNGVFVASGNVGGNPSIVISRNGVDWFKNAVSNVPSNTAMTFGNGRFLGVQGANGDTYYSDSFFPDNQVPSGSLQAPGAGQARTPIAFSASATDADGDPLVYIWDFNDGQPLLDGPSGTKTYLIGGTYTVNLTITDSHGGVTQLTRNITIQDPLAPDQWIKRDTPVTSTRTLADIAVGQSSTGAEQLFAVGNYYAFASADGATWSTIINNDTLRDMRGVIYTGGRYLMCGENFAFDGTSWRGAIFSATNVGGSNTIANVYRNTTAANTGALNDIAIGGSNVVVAVGNGGRITRSTDNGDTWTEVTHGLTTITLKSVAYHDGKFVATGNDTILTSDDEGSTWSNRSTALGVNSVWVESAAYLNDRFLFGGYLCHIRSSTNQVTSLTTTTLSPGQRTLGFAYQNGIYLAVGELDNSGTTPSNAVSIDGVNWSRVTMTAQEKRKAVVSFKGAFVTVGEKLSIWQSGDVLLPNLLVKDADDSDLLNSASLHDFGRVAPASSASTSFALHNTGSGPLEISGLSTTGDFSVSGLTLPATIAPGGQATITIAFAPTVSGVKNGTLTITSNGSAAQPYTIDLTGLANTPPAFSGMSISVVQGDSNSIQEPKILLRASDAEGHVVGITGLLQSTSAQGGTISRSGGKISYRAAPSYVGADAFTVLLSDGFSTTEAVIQVNVTADPGLNPNNPPAITMDGSIPSVSFFGIPGRTYGIQRSTDLTTWTQIGTASALAGGRVSYADNSPPPGAAYYRIVYPAQ